jgi:hypothetical protein
MVRRTLAVAIALATVLAAGAAFAQPEVETQAEPDEVTPARLSYTAGSVSFWRPGGSDWAPAQVNTPLAAGDELFTGRDGNLEMQVGGRAFIRAWGDTQLGLTTHDPGFVQLRLAAGHLALDLRDLDAGDTLEIDTPAAAFTIDQPGYYRIDVTGERTSFVTRRGGRATLTTAAGNAAEAVAPDEAVILDGAPAPSVQRLAAPEPDVWDRWNDARTAALLTTVSASHVPPQVYGASELDHYGTWRSDPTYGSVWVPAYVAPGWVPYSTGRWIWDPRFHWTWVDTAPWGWAPYHYGRWVHVGGGWAWAPGPIVVRPRYAPALVAFYGSPGLSVAFPGPSIGWVALGWGEPVVPWWGRPGFVGRRWWGGWGGPRVKHVTVHRNVTVVNAVVAVRSDHFGRRSVHETRITRPDVKRLHPVRGRLAVKPDPVSFTPGSGRAARPSRAQVSRPVVSARPPAHRTARPPADDRRDAPADGRSELRRSERGQARPDGRGDDKARARPGVSDPRPPVRSGGNPERRPDSRGANTDVRPGARDAEPRVRGGKPDGKPEARPDGRVDDRARGGPGERDAQPQPRLDARPDGNPDDRHDGTRQVRPPASRDRRPDARPEPKAPAVGPPAARTAPSVPAAPPAPATPPVPQRREPPRAEPERPRPQPSEPTRGEPRRVEPPRSEGPRVDPRRRDATMTQPRRGEMPRAEKPRLETPRRAVAPAPERVRRPEPARTVSPDRRPAPRPGRPAPPVRGERARPEQ